MAFRQRLFHPHITAETPNDVSPAAAMRVYSDSSGLCGTNHGTDDSVCRLNVAPVPVMMMRLPWLSAVATCFAVVLSLAAGDLTAQEIVPEVSTPTLAPQLQLGLFSSSLSSPAPVIPSAASAPTPLPAGTSAILAPDGEQVAAPSRDASSAGKGDEGESSWSALTAAQRSALGPLAGEWAFLDSDQKRKWLEIAHRLPRLSAARQARMQARMVEWARMTPQARARARLHFEQAGQVAPGQRKERWDAYLALPAELRRQLAERAAMAASPALGVGRRSTFVGLVWRESQQTKPGIGVGSAPVLKPVAPALVQVRPGASTTLMSRRPPVHQQAGMATIVATPGLVDRATLLPQRGAQGAAMHAVSASEPVPRR